MIQGIVLFHCSSFLVCFHVFNYFSGSSTGLLHPSFISVQHFICVCLYSSSDYDSVFLVLWFFFISNSAFFCTPYSWCEYESTPIYPPIVLICHNSSIFWCLLFLKGVGISINHPTCICGVCHSYSLLQDMRNHFPACYYILWHQNIQIWAFSCSLEDAYHWIYFSLWVSAHLSSYFPVHFLVSSVLSFFIQFLVLFFLCSLFCISTLESISPAFSMSPVSLSPAFSVSLVLDSLSLPSWLSSVTRVGSATHFHFL